MLYSTLPAVQVRYESQQTSFEVPTYTWQPGPTQYHGGTCRQPLVESGSIVPDRDPETDRFPHRQDEVDADG